jgi:hypothetical protein
MNDAVDMGSGAMIKIQIFIKIGSGIQKFIGGTHIDTQTGRVSRKPTFIFSKIGYWWKSQKERDYQTDQGVGG